MQTGDQSIPIELEDETGQVRVALAARDRRRAALEKNSPRWLRWLAVVAGIFGVLAIAIAVIANSEWNTGGRGGVAFVVWAVVVASQCVIAAVIFLANAAGRTPWGLAIGLAVFALVGGTGAFVAFVVAAGNSGLPGWAGVLGVVIHTLAIVTFGLGVLWPAVARLLRSISATAARS